LSTKHRLVEIGPLDGGSFLVHTESDDIDCTQEVNTEKEAFELAADYFNTLAMECE